MDLTARDKVATWILGGILLLAILLRAVPFEDLTRGSLEFGEGWVMAKAAAPFSRIMGAILPEEAPLKYYLLHAVLYFGRSEFLVRFPALLFDLASILALFFLGKLLFNKKAGLLASFFMAISVWHIHHAAMARNYPLYAFSAILSVFFLYRATQGRSFRDWFLWGAALIFSFYAFYASLFIIAAQLVWFFLYHGRRRDLTKRCLFTLGLFLIAALPGALRWGHALERKMNFGTGHWGLQGYAIWEALRDHFGGLSGTYPLGIFVFLLSLFWLVRTPGKKQQVALLFTLIALPLCSYVACVYFFKISVIPRYFLHLYPFFLLVAAAGITSWKSRLAKWGGVLVFMLPLGFYGFYQAGLIGRDRIPYDYLRHYADFRHMASVVEKNQNDLDYVAVDPWQSIFSIQYYLDKKNENPILIGNDSESGGCPVTEYSNSNITLYGVMDDLSFLQNLAAAGRLLVIDTVGLIKIDRYKDHHLLMTWLREHAYRVEHAGLKASKPAYEPEHPADFYFIRPPPSSYEKDRRVMEAARARLKERIKDIWRLSYPFNRKDQTLRENQS